MKRDYLKAGALLFALVATASAEYELARQVGFNQWVAAAVPGALDIYTVRALRAHRDVLAAVGAMIGVNAASHLVTAGLLPVNVPLVVAVSAIAPLVLWRVHRLADEVTTEVTTDRRDVGQSELSDDRSPSEPPALSEVVIPSPAHTVPYDLYKAVDIPKKVTSAVPAEQPREVVTEVIALSPAELRRKARSLNAQAVRSTRRPVTIQTLQNELGLSRRDATELRREVVEARS